MAVCVFSIIGGCGDYASNNFTQPYCQIFWKVCLSLVCMYARYYVVPWRSITQCYKNNCWKNEVEGRKKGGISAAQVHRPHSLSVQFSAQVHMPCSPLVQFSPPRWWQVPAHTVDLLAAVVGGMTQGWGSVIAACWCSRTAELQPTPQHHLHRELTNK